MRNTTFPDITDKPNFPQIEEKWMHYWDEIKGLERQLEQSKDKPEFTFYDGPPFATGLPHYGHILAGTIKDVVCRYAHQTDHHVERRFGWDCHGLPVEYEVNKQLNVHTRKEVLAMGIDKYNEECRKIVMKYSEEWKHVVKRFGRWIDFENNYKTMNLDFMESVWYVFKQIYNKGKVYRGVKVMPYSTGINTVMSNFEANLNYKEATDPSIYVRFKIVDEDAYLLAWTTTPWTLPSNIALAVNEEFTYLKVQYKEHTYYIGEPRFAQVQKECNWNKKEVKTLGKVKGSDLKGKRYEPLFPYFKSRADQGNFVLLTAKYVTADSGTCIVHQAPAFGEDDYYTCLNNKLLSSEVDVPCPIDEDGKYTDEVPDFKGQYVKDADSKIIDKLKSEGKLVKAGTITHNYPFCYRSETPLLYKSHASWFINVESVRDDLLANNEKTRWVPKAVQEHRFHNWLADARDWCFSRNRYWGNPIPIWVSDDGEEIVVVGSVKELEELSGVTGITDIHKHKIDHITIPSKQGRGDLKRIEEVFDCWFESGCVPYGLYGYPNNLSEEEHAKKFPADFIGEGLDQTRGWFYTLMVISTILKNQPPFKNLIVNGLVLAKDGKKMSKSKKNYSDPMEVANKYGVDSVRLYLCNSPVVRADPLKFKDEGLAGIIRDVLLPWYNSFRFFTLNANRYEQVVGQTFVPVDLSKKFKNDEFNNYLDKWLVAASDLIIKQVRKEMDEYKLYAVVPKILEFLEDMTNWYIKLNRPRLKGDLNDNADWLNALSTLHHANMVMSILMAAYAPYLAEHTYQSLKLCFPKDSPQVEDSVHLRMIPSPLFYGTGDAELESKVDRVISAVNRMKDVITLTRKCRETLKIGNSQPLHKVVVLHDDPEYFKDLDCNSYYIHEDGNVKEVEYLNDITLVEYKAEPDWASLGKKLLKKMKDVKAGISKMSSDELKEIKRKADEDDKFEFEVAGCKISGQEVVIKRKYNEKALKEKYPDFTIMNNSDVTVLLDPRVSDNLKNEGWARHLKSAIQKARKSSGIHLDDLIEIYVQYDDESVQKALDDNKEWLHTALKSQMDLIANKPEWSVQLHEEKFELDGRTLTFTLCPAVPRLNLDTIKKDFGDHWELVYKHLTTQGVDALIKRVEEGKGHIKLDVFTNEEMTETKNLDIECDKHFKLPERY